MLAAGLLFFLAAGLSDPFKRLVISMNDPKVNKSAGDWVMFLVLTLPVGAVWAAAWLWFKACEKRFLDVWFAKAPTVSPQPASDGSNRPDAA